MNGKNRHKKYRKSIYRRRNINAIIIVSIVCLLLFVTAFLIIGNLLKAQSDKRHEYESSDTETTVKDNIQNEKAPVKNISAHPVFLETQGSGNFASRLDALTKKGIFEANVPLNTPEGDLLFKSKIAEKIGYPQSNANVTLGKALPAAKTKNVYLSGIFYVNAFDQDDPLIRSVELSRDAAIVAEALNAGFDDIVLIAPQMTEDHIEEAIRFTEDIKALSENGYVGLCISDPILSIDDTQRLSQIIEHLNGKNDFLAIDLSKTDISSDVSTVSDSISPNQHYMLMYKIRVLLPRGETDDIVKEVISEAESNGIKNIQIMP